MRAARPNGTTYGSGGVPRLDAARWVRVDWLAAGTYDKSGLSLFTLQVTHKIENTDIERDYIVKTVSARTRRSRWKIENFSTGYHSRNGAAIGSSPTATCPSSMCGGSSGEIAEGQLHRQPGQATAQIVFGAGGILARPLLLAHCADLAAARSTSRNVDIRG